MQRFIITTSLYCAGIKVPLIGDLGTSLKCSYNVQHQMANYTDMRMFHTLQLVLNHDIRDLPVNCILQV